MAPRDQRQAGATFSRLFAALLAGAIAILINTALLALADVIGITTSRGGLLRLVRDIAAKLASSTGSQDLWTALDPVTTTGAFKTGFHIFVGLLMALFYAYVLEPILPGRPWVKGLIYAGLVWLLNAFLVLPLLGEGIAGSALLGLGGIAGFALIHTVFFVLLAAIYANLPGRHSIWGPSHS